MIPQIVEKAKYWYKKVFLLVKMLVSPKVSDYRTIHRSGSLFTRAVDRRHSLSSMEPAVPSPTGSRLIDSRIPHGPTWRPLQRTTFRLLGGLILVQIVLILEIPFFCLLAIFCLFSSIGPSSLSPPTSAGFSHICSKIWWVNFIFSETSFSTDDSLSAAGTCCVPVTVGGLRSRTPMTSARGASWPLPPLSRSSCTRRQELKLATSRQVRRDISRWINCDQLGANSFCCSSNSLWAAVVSAGISEHQSSTFVFVPT